MGGNTKAKLAAKREKRQQKQQAQERASIVRQAFVFLPWTHPFWYNVLPYLTTRDKLSLRCVNTHCKSVVDTEFRKAFTLIVDPGIPTKMLPTFIGENNCANQLKALEHPRAHDVVTSLTNCAHSLVTVDLSFSRFADVKMSIDTLVENCRQLKCVSLRSLREDVYVSGDSPGSATLWPFSAFVEHPLPTLEFLDIAGNGSAGLLPAVMTSLTRCHPALHTLYADSGAVDPGYHLSSQVNVLTGRLHPHAAMRGLIRRQDDLVQVLDTWLDSPSLKDLTLCHADQRPSIDWLKEAERCWSDGRCGGERGCRKRRRRVQHLAPSPVLVVLRCRKQAAGEGGHPDSSSSSFSSTTTPVVTHTDCWHQFHPDVSLEHVQWQGLQVKRSSCPAGHCKHLLSALRDS